MTDAPIQIAPVTPTELEPAESTAGGERLYAVLDACDAPQVPPKVRALGDLAVSLYAGTAVDQYYAIAPYLACADANLVSWIADNLQSDRWGILITANCSFAELRKHLRRFLTVEGPEDQRWLFRFYDPRVLPVFLESSTPQECAEFFGPIRSFLITDAQGTWQRITPRQT